MNLVFYVAAAVALISTIMVIIDLHAVHSLLYLIVSLLAVALIFLALGAPFVAALEVIIYAGAIMVLFVFFIMMLNLGPQAALQETRWVGPRIWIGPAVLTAALLIVELAYLFTRNGENLSGTNVVESKQVAVALFGSYGLGVELASVLLLAALIGAYHLGRRDKPQEHPGGRP